MRKAMRELFGSVMPRDRLPERRNGEFADEQSGWRAGLGAICDDQANRACEEFINFVIKQMSEELSFAE